MTTKKYRFSYHLNKPMTREFNKCVWSLHFRNVCHLVYHIDCLVPTNTKNNKRQPWAVVQGFCTNVDFNENREAVIS